MMAGCPPRAGCRDRLTAGWRQVLQRAARRAAACVWRFRCSTAMACGDW